MGYLTPEPSRTDAATLLPGARSVLMVAARYADGPGPRAAAPPEDAGDADAGPRARLSNYARGRDYHRVMGEALRALAARARAVVGEGVAMRAFVDTAPILERAFARAAGLGWFGKNACLIHPRTGSYFFLGGIVLDREVAPSAPFAADRCGTCTACIDACPTDAIVAPRTVDSRRCITYWNVEHRGAIPEAERAALGPHVFGCDICQQVCPWNKFAAPPSLPGLAARPENVDPPLLALIARARESFKRHFGDTAITRARKRGLLRNAAVVAGNAGDRRLAPVLEELAAGEDAMVAEHARWARERIG